MYFAFLLRLFRTFFKGNLSFRTIICDKIDFQNERIYVDDRFFLQYIEEFLGFQITQYYFNDVRTHFVILVVLNHVRTRENSYIMEQEEENSPDDSSSISAGC